ncbi:MAG TPA: hypothetical protein EYP67_07005 [Methanosarcinales archaeon]|nr:hypothetical protein [Methanosarcinales archaeon]
MEEALQKLDDLSKDEFSKFGEHLDTFVIDGSALSGDTLVEREVLTKIRLLRNYFQYRSIKITSFGEIKLYIYFLFRYVQLERSSRAMEKVCPV